MPKRRKISRIVTYAGFAAIAVIVLFTASIALENSKADAFSRGYGDLVTQSRSLTAEYQQEVGKWQAKQYDNATMANVTDGFIPRFQQVIDTANSLDPPAKFQSSRDLFVKSVDSEMQSYQHFRQYLTTGQQAEDDKSNELLSLALQYEEDSFASYKAAGG